MNFLVNFIIISFLFSQNFVYDDEDWFVVSNPGHINSMTIKYDEIIFTATKGVYSYNQNDQSLSFIPEFIRGFDNSEYKIIHYDKFRDHVWFLTNDKIFFKPDISSIWREIEFYDLNILDSSNIKNIGSTSEYILIKSNNNVIVLNPYTGKVVLYDEHRIDYYLLNDMPISWSSTRYDTDSINVDFQSFTSYDGYSFVSNDYIEYNGVFIGVTTAIKDNDKNIWIGTTSGELFKCNLYMNTFRKMPNIPQSSNINYSYYDEYNEWWISTNDAVTFYGDTFLLNRDIFLLHWKENINHWSYIKADFGLNLKSSDITSILRYQNNVYIGTNKGLFIYNLNLERWIDYDRNHINSYVYDIKRRNDYIYIATNKGLNIILDSPTMLVESNFFKIFNFHSVTDLEMIDNFFYIASDIGLYEYKFDDNNLHQISDHVYKKIDSDNEDNLFVSKKNKIFKINNFGREYLSNFKNIKDICYCDGYIWINNFKYATIFNLASNESFEYNESDGLLSNKIFSIQCDEDWVWFSTDNGLVLYNWSKYHDNKK